MDTFNSIRAVIFAIAILTLFLVGCADKEAELTSLPTPNSVFSLETTEYPSVVQVIAPNGSGLCTGTFISERAVLTAAHCALRSGTFKVISTFGTFTTSNVVKFGPGVLEDPNDVAVLIFNSNVASRADGQVANLSTSVGNSEVIRIVGFGCNNVSTRRGSGVKRTGTNQVYQISDYIELVSPDSDSSVSSVRGIVGSENRAGSCFGDSGGPMFRNEGQGSEIVGIAHAGGDQGDYIFSEYVNMTRSDNLNFLREVNSIYNLDIQGL